MKKWVRIIKELGFFNGFIMDHLLFSKDGVVSQPYSASMADLKKLIIFCEEWDLNFVITSKSVHSDECITITIRENQKETTK